LHDINDPANQYIQPSNGVRQCLHCHRAQMVEYRKRPKGPCKRCGSIDRRKDGTCNDCRRRRQAAQEIADAEEFL
jgi:hypothetical protein